MTTIKVKIPTETAVLVQQYVDEARHLDGSRLTVEALVEMLLDDVALVVRRPGCLGGRRHGRPAHVAQLPGWGGLMSHLKRFLRRWLVDTRDPIWLLGIILVTFAATHKPPESDAALIKIDDRNFFECADSGCWWMVRSDMTWADLAQRINADATKLRADNPQVSRNVVQAGQLIRLRNSSKAAH